MTIECERDVILPRGPGECSRFAGLFVFPLSRLEEAGDVGSVVSEAVAIRVTHVLEAAELGDLPGGKAGGTGEGSREEGQAVEGDGLKLRAIGDGLANGSSSVVRSWGAIFVGRVVNGNAPEQILGILLDVGEATWHPRQTETKLQIMTRKNLVEENEEPLEGLSTGANCFDCMSETNWRLASRWYLDEYRGRCGDLGFSVGSPKVGPEQVDPGLGSTEDPGRHG